MYSPFDTICVGIGESKPSASSAGVHLASCASLNHASSSRDPGALSGILTLLSVPHGCPRDRCASASSFLGASALASAPGLDALQRVAQAALLAAEVPGVVDGTAAVVAGDGRVRAEGTGAIARARRPLERPADRVGRDARHEQTI